MSTPLLSFVGTVASALVAAGASAATELEELTVTALRTPVERAHAPAIVDVIDNVDLSSRRADFVVPYLRALPGIAISEAGPPGSLAEVRVRGAEANHVLVLVDGIEINDPATGGAVDFAHIAPSIAQRIEVLRGPQSALWGSDALAGVIHLDTSPPPGALERTFEVSTGSLDTRSGALRWADATRGPWYYGVNASHLDSGGANVSTVGGEDDGYRRTVWHLTGGHRTGQTTVEAVLGGVEASSEFDPTPFPLFVPRDGDEEVESERQLAGLTGTLSRGPWTHVAHVSAFETDNDSLQNGDRVSGSRARKSSLQYQLSRRMDRGDLRQLATVAVEHERERFRNSGPVTAFGDPNQRQSFESTGAVLEYSAGWRALDIALSVRRDWNDEFEDAVTHRAAIRWALGERTSLFASAGTGIKNPTFTERYGFTPDTFVGNPDLEPESSRGISAGALHSFAEDAWVRIEWFRDRLEDEIDGFVFDPALGGFTAVNREGTSRREGAEAMAWLALGATSSLQCDYTYLDATEPVEGRQVDEIRRPRHAGGCTLGWHTSARIELQGGIRRVGARRDLDFSTFPSESVALDAYTLVHATAVLEVTRRLTAFARIENALDDRYQDVFGYDTAGRRLHIGLSASLD